MKKAIPRAPAGASDAVPGTARSARAPGALLEDRRAQGGRQRALMALANQSAQALQLQASSLVANGGASMAQKDKPNRTGLPDRLKHGVEALSGMSLDQVRVHYNSARPAQLGAHAFAQGRDIHLAPGQQQHLPHEAWHVVQQAQGRVAANYQLRGGVGVNRDTGLESEADRMGRRASGPSKAPVQLDDPAPWTARTLQLHKVVSDPRHVAEEESQTLFRQVPQLHDLRQQLLGTDVKDWTWDLKEKCIALVAAHGDLEALIKDYVRSDDARRAKYGLKPLDPKDTQSHITMIAAHVRWTLKVLGSGEFDEEPADKLPLSAAVSERSPPAKGGDMLANAKTLVANKDAEAVHAFLLHLQRLRALHVLDSSGEQAELLCLRFLQHSKHTEHASAKPASASARGVKVQGVHLPTIPASFAKALAAARSHHPWDHSEAHIVLDGLHQATQNLLFFMNAEKRKDSKLNYPSPDQLHTLSDLERVKAQIIATPLTPNEDDVRHAYARLDLGSSASLDDDTMAALVASHPDSPAKLAPRLAIRAAKSANTWLKYAMPYLELKQAFLDGWQEHDFGSVAERGFYYVLTRSAHDAHREMAGDSDVQQGFLEPVSGTVALALALQEVYNTAACHEDALALVRLLGSVIQAKGRLRDDDGGLALLPTLKLAIYHHLLACDSPLAGVRLRDDRHHSLVLLFENVPQVGLMGARFDTVAGRNTERLLHFSTVQFLSSAWGLLDEGLSKALKSADAHWVLEWEVFAVARPQALEHNLRSHWKESHEAVVAGGKRNLAGLARRNEDMGFEENDPDRPMWESGADELTRGLIAAKPRYLAGKEATRREQAEHEAARQHAQAERATDYVARLLLVKADPAQAKALLQEIKNDLGENKMFDVARAAGMGFEKVMELMPE